LFIIGVLALSAGVQFLSVTRAQTATASCPASDTLHITAYGGVPAGFNTLAVYNPSGYAAAYLAFKGAGRPMQGIDGVTYNYTSVFDHESYNSNFTIWTFHIRNSETWSNGQPVTAQDIINNWSPNFALNPNSDPTFPPLHSEITSIVAANSSTVVFNLNATDAHLDERISPVLDTLLYPSQFNSAGGSTTGFGTNMSEGPFYIDNYQAGQSSMIMLRNPYYKPQPTVCEIVWNFVENEAQNPTYVAAGTADMAFIPTGAAATLATLPNIHILNQPDELITFLEYNQTRYPFNMTAFRQALVYGINQSAVSSIAYSGYSHPAYSAEGAVPPSSKLYNPNQVQYSYDPSKALSLLSSIGITKQSDGFLHYKNGTIVHTTIWSDDDIYSDSVAAPIIQNNLRSLGFQVNLQLVAWNTMTGYGFKNTFGVDNGLLLHTSNALYPGNAYVTAFPINFVWALFWLPISPELWPQGANAQYLSNFTAIEATNNPTLEYKYAANIQALNAQYLPAVVLSYDDNTMAYSTARFTGWPTAPNGYMWPSQVFWNLTSILALKPVAVSTTTTPAATSTVVTTVTTSGTPTVVTTVSTVTAPAAPSGTDYTSIIAAVIVIVIIVAIAAIAVTRRKPAAAKP
jgi:ABC-type transport system substrate-binding protein